MTVPWLSWIPAAGRWLWRKIRGRPTVQADRGGVAAGRDQTISGPVVTGDRPGPVIVAHSGATVNVSVYYDGLPQAKGNVHDHFDAGRRLQEAEQHEPAIAEFEKALAVAQNDSQRCALHMLIGNSFLATSRLGQAEGHYQRSLAAGDKAQDKEGQARALGNLGIVYRQRGEPDKAEEHHRKALAIAEEIGDRLGQANQLGNLGLVYRRRGDLDKAEEHEKAALAIDRDIGNRLGEAHDLSALGLVYADRGQLNRAQGHHRKALAIYQEIGNKLGQATQLANLGIVYRRRDRPDEGQRHIMAALAIDQKLGYRLGEAQDLASLGDVYAHRGEVQQALRHYRHARRIFARIGACRDLEKVDRAIRALKLREALREAIRLLDEMRAEAPASPKPKRPRKKGPPSKP
jgi:tetratricopeptide (TPR) repeat protein